MTLADILNLGRAEMSDSVIGAVPLRFGPPERVSESDSTLIAYALDTDGDEANFATIRCAMADPDEELRAIRDVVALVNAREQILATLVAAERLLDSVAYVTKDGDTKRPLRLLREVMGKVAA